MDLCESEASLIYKMSSRVVKATLKNPVLKKERKEINVYAYMCASLLDTNKNREDSVP